MQETELLKLVEKTLSDKKALNITVLEVKKLTSVTDYFIICTATSSRHAKALADHLQKTIQENNIKPFGVEGNSDSNWILLDYLSIVVHIMLEDTRKFYDLEALWKQAESNRFNKDKK
ncbi:MAG: ribosome silencing factor [Gammaproteobacteria bacterium RIFOXYB2_FULL_38_6]|nr:MAG: ribosome silencing factor [Gammaproteobacteria bacterium RIFOXYB2_FULL_38_6]